MVIIRRRARRYVAASVQEADHVLTALVLLYHLTGGFGGLGQHGISISYR